jgi:hypothetical protein
MSHYVFNHTIRFIAFSGEEVGTYGSFTYARDAYQQGDNIYAVINLDMIGYAETTEGGKIIRFFHPERSAWIGEFAVEVSEKYHDVVEFMVESLPNYRGADHQAFIDYGYDGVWIAHHDGYPWANSPEDTPDHLNWSYQVKATKFLLAVVAEFAMHPIPVQVVITTPHEASLYVFNRLVLSTHFGKYPFKEIRGTTFLFGRTIASAEVYSSDEIEFVVFCIDDNFISWDSSPPYEWKIQGKHFPPIGRHRLVAYAMTRSGEITSDEMDIRIFTLSYQYSRW